MDTSWLAAGKFIYYRIFNREKKQRLKFCGNLSPVNQNFKKINHHERASREAFSIRGTDGRKNC